MQTLALLFILLPANSASANSINDLLLQLFGNVKVGDMELTLKQQYEEIQREYTYSNSEYENKISGLFYDVSGVSGLNPNVDTRYATLNIWNGVFINHFEDSYSSMIPFNNYNIQKSAAKGDTNLENTGYALIPRNIFLIPGIAKAIDPSKATDEQKNDQINWMMDKLNQLTPSSYGIYQVMGRTNIAIARVATEMGGIFENARPVKADSVSDAKDPHGLMTFRMTPYPSFTHTSITGNDQLKVSYKSYGYVDHTNYVKIINGVNKELELRSSHIPVSPSGYDSTGTWRDGSNVEFTDSFEYSLDTIRQTLGTGEMTLKMNDGFGRMTTTKVAIPEKGAPNLKITTVSAVCSSNNEMIVKVTADAAGSSPLTTLLAIKVDGTAAATETITLKPGETKLVTKTLTCAPGKKVEAEINPDKTQPDKETSWEDNKKETEVLSPKDPGQVAIKEKSLQLKFGNFKQPVRLTSTFSVPIIITNNSSEAKTTSINFSMTGTMNQAYQIPRTTCGQSGCFVWYETKYRNLPLTITGTSPVLTVPAFGNITWTASSGLNYAISGGDPSSQSNMPLNVWGPGSEYGVPDSSAQYFPEIKATATNPSEYLNPSINMFVPTNYEGKKPKPPVLTE